MTRLCLTQFSVAASQQLLKPKHHVEGERIEALENPSGASLRSTLPTLIFLTAMSGHVAIGQTATLRPGVQPPEDPAVRAEAVRLLEQAVQVSTPPTWTNVEIDTRFHVDNPAPGEPSDGEHILTVGSWWKLRRHEWIYGASHLILVRNADLFHWLINEGHRPPFADLIENHTPIDLVRFNREDVIHSITEGANASLCINFDSVFGERETAGRICVDRQNHWMISSQLGDVLTLNSSFVPFNNAFVPQHVERWVGGLQQFVFEQTITPKTDFPPDFFSVPEKSNIKGMEAACKEFRPAHPLYAPQPPPLSASPTVTDIKMQALVGPDGHVSNVTAVEYLYPELNRQATQIVSGWTFTPASCDAKPVSWYTTLTVQFKGR